MLARQRQERILEEVRGSGGARVSDLVDSSRVSDMTVRRDIEALARRGLVARVHGGATAVGARSAEEPGFEAKSLLQTAQKEAIARGRGHAGRARRERRDLGGHDDLRRRPRAARRPRPHGGHQLASRSPTLLHRQHRADLTVVLTGGTRTPSDALVGPLAVAALRTLHVDWLFLGVHGVDERAGFTTPNLVEAETDRALHRRAPGAWWSRADHTKWGVVGLSSIARLDEVDVLVTDDGLDADAARARPVGAGAYPASTARRRRDGRISRTGDAA